MKTCSHGFPRRMAPAFAVACLVLLGPCTTAAAATLRVAGSDLFGPAWRETLQTHAAAARVDVELNLKGSLPGREALLSGRADAALLAHAPELDGADNGAAEFAGFRRVPIAWVAAVIVVPDENPLQQITYEQLASVFGVSAAQSARYWGDLGLTADWASRAVTPVVISRDAGLTLDFFAHAVLLSRPLQSGLPEHATLPAVLEHVATDRGSVALVPVVPAAASGTRALLVTAVAGEVAFGPSAENVATGDYPLRLPLELVFRAGTEKAVAPLVSFFTSDAGVKAIEASQLVPLPAGVRARLAAEFGR